MGILEKINSPDDLKKLDREQLELLAHELRSYIVCQLASSGGHLASSLGVVELTIALHSIFDMPSDRIIWDVGHQCYPHKILTGRRDRFSTIRKKGGLSGFPKREESPYDSFGAGHASTSISAGLGMAVGRDLTKRSNKVVAVIGDGSMNSGMAFEGLNQAGHLKSDLIVVLNDNEMSISPNVGALSSYLSRLMTGDFYSKLRKDVQEVGKVLPLGDQMVKFAKKVEEHVKGFITPGMLFEELGFTYVGPIDGHNIGHLLTAFSNIKKFDKPTLVHVITKKGKGFSPAEKKPSLFHGIGPYNHEDGSLCKSSSGNPSYTSVFGKTLVKLARENDKIVAITAAMSEGTGLVEFAEEFPSRFFDVGIAEEHAVTFAGGLAAEGLKPVLAVYSTFLQRGYDQIIHDVALQNLPVVFALDRAGLVGADGPTHHGSFDLSYLRHIPGLTVIAPADENELQHALATAVACDGPVALRYPRGNGVGVQMDEKPAPWTQVKGRLLVEPTADEFVLILNAGTTLSIALDAVEIAKKSHMGVALFDARFVKPLDREAILDLAYRAKAIVTLEENSKLGGFGSSILELLSDEGIYKPVRILGLPDAFVEHGTQDELKRDIGLTSTAVFEVALDLFDQDL